jgi:hypothetical protein
VTASLSTTATWGLWMCAVVGGRRYAILYFMHNDAGDQLLSVALGPTPVPAAAVAVQSESEVRDGVDGGRSSSRVRRSIKANASGSYRNGNDSRSSSDGSSSSSSNETDGVVIDSSIDTVQPPSMARRCSRDGYGRVYCPTVCALLPAAVEAGGHATTTATWSRSSSFAGRRPPVLIVGSPVHTFWLRPPQNSTAAFGEVWVALLRAPRRQAEATSSAVRMAGGLGGSSAEEAERNGRRCASEAVDKRGSLMGTEDGRQEDEDDEQDNEEENVGSGECSEDDADEDGNGASEAVVVEAVRMNDCEHLMQGYLGLHSFHGPLESGRHRLAVVLQTTPVRGVNVLVRGIRSPRRLLADGYLTEDSHTSTQLVLPSLPSSLPTYLP